MASALVASATSTSPAVAERTGEEGHDIDRRREATSAPIGSAPEGSEASASAGDDSGSGSPDTVDRKRPPSGPGAGDPLPGQAGEPEKPVGAGTKQQGLSAAKDDSGIPGRTVATSAKGFGEGPLPRELRRIILEVAKTGKCSWLSWNQETATLSSKRDADGAKSTASLGSNSGSGHPPAAPSKASPAKKPSSSSPSSQYAASLTAATGNVGGRVQKHPSFGGGTATPRRGHLPRKRHRNGGVLKGGERMRFGNPDGVFGRSGSSPSSRKRPLVFVRTGSNVLGGNANNPNSSGSSAGSVSGSAPNNAPNATATNAPGGTSFPGATLGGMYSSAPSSVGSGRSTGSEPDYDSAQYECDSEGTSATTNSEISLRKTNRHKRSGTASTQGAQINSGVDTWTDTGTMGDGEDETNSVDGSNAIPGSPYKTLQTAFRGALGLVLDHFYQNRGSGYKLSPAEKKRNERFAETSGANTGSSGRGDSAMKSDKLASLLSSEYVFQQRRQRLMAMLLPGTPHSGHDSIPDEPPFTIQRIAEVLIAPDRYYTQTHKLCNCLEKLLLVNSSTDSFGGSSGGDTSQRRREERELAALADEKGRQEHNLRQRRLSNNRKTPIDELVEGGNAESFFPLQKTSEQVPISREEPSTVHNNNNNDNTAYEAKSRASPEKSGNVNEPIGGSNHEATNTGQKAGVAAAPDASTSREMLEALARASLRTRFDQDGINSQHNPSNAKNEQDVRAIAENRGMTNSPPLPSLNMASVAGIALPGHGGVNGMARQYLSDQPPQNSDHPSIARAGSPILFPPGNESHLDTTATNMHMLQLHHAVAMAGASLNRTNNTPTLDNLMTIDANTISQMRSHTGATGTGPGSESTDGRSSASNSDIDSESDDISFDDSASDRSDGSDSGSASAHYEPFTAARAMALNRMQQQQRLQSRVLTSLGTSFQGEGYRPPADSEYQSGDSIDSTRAEDSGGSDSSDMTD